MIEELTTAAPAMAGLLLAAEWTADDDECMWCHGTKPFTLEFKDGSSIAYGGHETDCMWLYVMNTTGLLQ